MDYIGKHKRNKKAINIVYTEWIEIIYSFIIINIYL